MAEHSIHTIIAHHFNTQKCLDYIKEFRKFYCNRNIENRYDVYCYILNNFGASPPLYEDGDFNNLMKSMPSSWGTGKVEKWVLDLEYVYCSWLDKLSDSEKCVFIHSMPTYDKMVFWKLVELINILSNFDGDDGAGDGLFHDDYEDFPRDE